MKVFLLLALVFSVAGTARAAELDVDLGHGVIRYQSQQLLHREDVRSVVVPADVAFHRTMHYRAVPLTALLQDLAPADQLQFVANDGFVASIPAALVLNDQGSIAWLAIEENAMPWPRLGKAHDDAGPFYVVWTRPGAAGVTSEQWPYQLKAINRVSGVSTRFPDIFPDAAQPANGKVQRGFVLFQHTCFACHTLNREGDAKLGPDLNVPYNPTEYLRADLLRAFIRNPRSLRHWPQAKMHGLDRKALSDADLDRRTCVPDAHGRTQSWTGKQPAPQVEWREGSRHARRSFAPTPTSCRRARPEARRRNASDSAKPAQSTPPRILCADTS